MFAQAFAGFFDAAWYCERYSDVAGSGADPLLHFVHHGIAEGRDPNRWFDSAWYQSRYADVSASAANPLVHYLQVGAAELRNPHPRFDAAWYVEQHPEAAANPLLYHLRVGERAGWPTEQAIAIADYLPATPHQARMPPRVSVDVVVPVYKGLAETQRCLNAVLADPERPPGRIIVIDDQSPEPALSAWLDELAAARKIFLVRNMQNLGFVASANRGMVSAGDHDVVLLNSDTEVPPGWLVRLAAQAYAGPRIASVSPFSNNATICSYPQEDGGPIPFGLSLKEVDDACRTVNAGRSIVVPTTVGFCMYIRRDALTALGGFDEKQFGRGYGEENDFCMRARARGWENRLACDVFVFHEGNVSFGPEGSALSAKSSALVCQRYPEYDDLILRHVSLDEVGPFRFAVTLGLFGASRLPKLLLVAHDLGGGVQRHVQHLVEALQGRAHCLLLAASTRGTVLSVPAVAGHPCLTLPRDRLDELVLLLEHAGVGRVHIHHTLGVDLDLRHLIHRLGVPFDVTVHDYFALCPQVNLLPWPDQPHCGEPGPAACNACIAARPSHGAREILAWRREQAWMYLEADRVLCPSEDARQRLVRYGIGGRAVVAPHEPVPETAWRVAAPPLRGPLRVAVLGVLANHKGAHAVAAVAEAADPRELRIDLIGSVETDFPGDADTLLHATGPYQEAELPALLARLKPHVVWFPAAWPETFSYTLSAALAAGLPVVATAIGAFPERLVDRPLTWLAPPTSSAEDWLALFGQVRARLKAQRGVATAPRAPVADFYATQYLTPPTPPTPAQRLRDLRRPGRTSVVVIPERLDGRVISPCAYIRLLQPLDHPAIGADLDVAIASATEALDYRCDLIVTQRHAVPDVASATALARHARDTGAALVYDLDDDLLNIPATHADATELQPKARVVERMLRLATQVWVSTDALAAAIAPVRADARVMPNALDERLWTRPSRPPRPLGAPLRVLCMGTGTHGDDFAMIQPGLERLKAALGDRVTVDMLGVTARPDLPAWVNRLSLPVVAAASYPGFVQWIATQPAWDVGLAPLCDTPFNRGKSAIKTLDYAALDLAVLASDVTPYRGSLADGPGGLLLPSDPGAWYAALSALRRDPARLRRLADGAYTAFLADGTLAVRAASWRAALQAARESVSAPEPAVRKRRVRQVA
ncbi:MAG: glycosyltransferase [Rhodospirillales bacterium]|nr:glycosyltransferase [Rhodospirillales bacterium]